MDKDRSKLFYQCSNLSIPSHTIDFQKLTCPLCRQSLIEPGNEHEPQSWQESDPDVGMHMFVTNGSVDLDRFLSGMHSIDQSTQIGDDNGSDSVRHGYSGMYS